MRKKLCMFAAVMCVGMAVTACGPTKSAEEKNVSQETETRQEIVIMEETGTEEEAETKEEEEETTEAQTEAEAENGGYEDNFAVDSAASAAFGKKIKAAVAEKDLEALEALVSYPLYMGFADGGVSVESKEDFIALGEDKIFTNEMVNAIAAADENGLSASMAGFSLTKDGKPNIVFGVTDGKLAIKGMNY